MLWASQVTIGNENGLRLRVNGEIGSLDWHQEEPNKLWLARSDASTQLITRMGPGADESAIAVSRVPAGLPEGYLEAFANLYVEAADAIDAARAGGVAQLPETVPGLDDGLAGMAFIDAMARSSAENGAWVRPAQL